MGYIKRWNIEDIIRQINAAKWACNDPNLDGFSTWPIKQDLYQIKWLLDDAINQCPNFSPEDEWLRDQEKKRLIQILKK